MLARIQHLLAVLARLIRDCFLIVVLFALALLVGMFTLLKVSLPYLLRAACFAFLLSALVRLTDAAHVALLPFSPPFVALYGAFVVALAPALSPCIGLTMFPRIWLWRIMVFSGIVSYVAAFAFEFVAQSPLAVLSVVLFPFALAVMLFAFATRERGTRADTNETAQKRIPI